MEIDLVARERRIYERLRARVVPRRPGTSSGVRDLALLLPDLTILLFRLARDPQVRTGDKLIAMLGLAYVISPIDLMPALLLGPLGAVDDLLVVAAALSRVVNHVHPDIVQSYWPGKGDALETIRRVTAWSESLVSRMALRVLGFRKSRS